jgi:CRISPR/Cas system-associated exonuclease Cas4 (RecB family)
MNEIPTECVRSFINKGWFTNATLRTLCKDRGKLIQGKKAQLITEIMNLYAPEELLAASPLLQRLHWSKKLVLSILIAGPKTKIEIFEHPLIQTIITHNVPELAFGRITSKMVTQKDVHRYIGRQLPYLQKKNLLVQTRKAGKWVYEITPWMLDYIRKKMALPSEEELLAKIRGEARSTLQFFVQQSPSTPVWATWKESFQKFRELTVELAENVTTTLSNLRFDLHALAVSSIASQYYCEKKVELTHQYGRKETPEAQIGTEAHERLLEGTVPTKNEDIWREIAYGRRLIVREMLLLGKYQDVFIMGVADGVCFNKGLPQLLVEHKFTRSRRPWHNYHVQTRLYGLLLHLMGFKTDRLKYALILAPPECKGKEELRKLPHAILANLDQDRFTIRIEERTGYVFVTDFKLDQTREELNWALGFWKAKREIIPTSRKGKCATCEFNTICPSSLV